MTITATNLERRVLRVLEHQPGLTAPAIAAELSEPAGRVTSSLAEMRRYGLTQPTGRRPAAGRRRWWNTEAGSTVLEDVARARAGLDSRR